QKTLRDTERTFGKDSQEAKEVRQGMKELQDAIDKRQVQIVMLHIAQDWEPAGPGGFVTVTRPRRVGNIFLGGNAGLNRGGPGDQGDVIGPTIYIGFTGAVPLKGGGY